MRSSLERARLYPESLRGLEFRTSGPSLNERLDLPMNPLWLRSESIFHQLFLDINVVLMKLLSHVN